MSIVMRRASLADTYDYTDCLISCLQTAYRGIASDEFLDNLPLKREERAEKFRKTLENPDLETFCILLDDAMIGFLTLHKGDGEIWAVYLREEFRSKGYGQVMLDFAIGVLRDLGYKTITLWVFAENHRARRFYERNAFCFDGTQRESDSYGKPLVQLHYARNFEENGAL